MTPAERRLKALEAILKVEQASDNPSKIYIEDLKLSIEQAKMLVKNASPDGYKMVS